jgi:hypothetical protein
VGELTGSLLQDLRYGVRRLAQNPGFAAAAIATLALVIGANSSIFSGANAALFRSLPFKEPDRLVILREFNLNESLKEGERRTGAGSATRVSNILVVLQVVLALVLLVVEGLMINSLLNVQGVDPGFDPSNLSKVRLPLEDPKYLIRIEGDMKKVTSQVDTVAEVINELDRDLAIPEIETMEQSLSDSLGT